MTYHTPVLAGLSGQITPTTASLRGLGLPITESGQAAMHLTPVAGIAEYGKGPGQGLDRSDAVAALQNTDAPAFNRIPD